MMDEGHQGSLTYFNIFFCLFIVWARVCHSTHVEVSGKLSGVRPHGFQVPNLGCQVWQQAPLATEPSRGPLGVILNDRVSWKAF